MSNEKGAAPDQGDGAHHTTTHDLGHEITANLTVPEVDSGISTLDAALAYARCGWYVLPVRRGQKHPGSVVGQGWPKRSTRNAQVITAWFTGTNYGIALHVGRSGAVVFDIDRPEHMPSVLAEAIEDTACPFQSTRVGEQRRGHALFLTPAGRTIGNGVGSLGPEWGEVRGTNGVIIVAPSDHEKASQGGRYAWTRTGPVPVLPVSVADRLAEGVESLPVAPPDVVDAFLAEHVGNMRPGLMDVPLRRLRQRMTQGHARYDAARNATLGVLRDARAGFYPAAPAVERVREAYVEAIAGERDAEGEFSRFLAWAVGQLVAEDPQTAADEVAARRHRVDPFDALRGSQGQDGALAGPSAPVAVTALKTSKFDQPDEEYAAFAERIAGEPSQAQGEAHQAYWRSRGRRIADTFTTERRQADEAAGLAGRIAGRVAVASAFLAEPDDGPQWRVEGLLELDQRALLTAPPKAGKTTLVGSLTACLLDGGDFLDRLPVEPVTGAVVVFDVEMSPRQHRRWLSRLGIRNTDRLHLVHLRGGVSDFNITNPAVRAWWTEYLRGIRADFVIVDPIAPLLSAAGIEENSAEVTRWTTAFDELWRDGGATGGLVVHHHGHNGDRARGHSALMGWPDALWTLTVDERKEQRYLRAIGRDVNYPETELHRDTLTGGLVLGETGTGRRALREQATEAKSSEDAARMLDVIEAEPGITVNGLVERLRPMRKETVGDLRRALVAEHRIRIESGPRNSFLCYPGGEVTGSQDHLPATGPLGTGPVPSLRVGNREPVRSLVPGTSGNQSEPVDSRSRIPPGLRRTAEVSKQTSRPTDDHQPPPF